MKVILISVIIPVFNKEEYLSECIKTVVSQTYKCLEIIIINDGSTDNSEKIIEGYQLNDKRIKYHNQKNQGVAASRNKGISVSKGEYIYFIDADDKIELNTIDKLVNKTIVSGTVSDIVVGNYYRVINNKAIKGMVLEDQLLKPLLSDLDNKVNMFLAKGRPLASSCNKLYKLDFIKTYKIEFKDKVFAEDRLFNLMCYVNKPNISIVNEYTYYYNIIENSRSREFSEGFYENCTTLLHVFYDYLIEKSLLSENEDLLQINALYDMENIMGYYYTYLGNIKSLNQAMELMKSDRMLDGILRQVYKTKLINKMPLSRKQFVRIRTLNLFYYYMPNSITSIFYMTLKRIIDFKRHVAKG